MTSPTPSNAANLPEWFLPRVGELLGKSSNVNDLQLVNIPGGGNNRVFRVAIDSALYVVKWYFAAPHDPRDRLAAEWKFASFAWRHGVRCIAEPIACDPERRLGVFGFIPGRRLAASELHETHIQAAIRFLQDINRSHGSMDAASLPIASEACFSVAAHIACVEQRLQKLMDTGHQRFDIAASEYFNQELMPTAVRVIESIRAEVRIRRRNEVAELPSTERILSPSDFGFHNALLDEQGEVRFFDFEYAGWDDPAKTVCDFFAQVEVPVSDKYRGNFIAALSPIGGADLQWRADLLQPLYLIKWCCIVLNPYLQIGQERRRFSVGREVELDECLDKARRVLARIR